MEEEKCEGREGEGQKNKSRRDKGETCVRGGKVKQGNAVTS